MLEKGDNWPISCFYQFACFCATILIDQPKAKDKDNYKDNDNDEDKTMKGKQTCFTEGGETGQFRFPVVLPVSMP